MLTAITAIGALVFAGLSLNATRDQVAIAEQGQITDRYTRAVEQLGQQGSDRIHVRIGAVYALERLTHDSPRDQRSIIDVLLAFVGASTEDVVLQLRSDPLELIGAECPNIEPDSLTAADIQAALTVLGRNPLPYVLPDDNQPLFGLPVPCLPGVNLAGANFDKVNLTGIFLKDAWLEAVDFNGAALPAADLSRTYLRNANLRDADLTHANLRHADLTSADLRGVDLSDADLRGADLSQADLRGARLDNVKHDELTVVSESRIDYGTSGEWW